MKSVKIFVSSPQDVEYERTLAATVFRQLREEFGGWVEIEPFFWEDGVLQLHDNPQAQTPLTSDYDIVICILWTRLGRLLHPGKFFRPHDNSPFMSGTQFEVETALSSYQTTGKPITYLFRRMEKKHIEVGAKDYRKAHSDFQEMETFYAELLGREYLQQSSNQYEKPWDFTKKLHKLMREYLTALAGKESLDTGHPRSGHLRVNPFRGLQSFNYDDAVFFRGRLSATLEVVEALKTQSKGQCPFVMVFGSSGLGKSSLVRAGVLPWLRQPGVVENVRFWRHVILIPSHDKGGDLFRLLATVLLDPKAGQGFQNHQTDNTESAGDCFDPANTAYMAGEKPQELALPEIGQNYDAHGNQFDVDNLATLLRDDCAKALNQIEKALQRIANEIGMKEAMEKPPLGRLVIFVDQFEEIFRNTQREQFMDAIELLVRSGWVWVLATARSDFFSECDHWPTLRRLKQGAGTYHLAPPTIDEFREIILRPAAAVDMGFEKRLNGRGLDDILIEAAYGNSYALPLLEFTLTQLYDKTDPAQRVIRFDTYDSIGGVQGALAAHAEASLAKVFPPLVQTTYLGSDTLDDDTQSFENKYGLQALHCFGSVALKLVEIGIGDGEKPVRKFPSKTTLESDQLQARLTNQLIDDRLLVVTADKQGNNISVSVAHEALLNCWPTLRNWIEKHRADLKILTRLKADAEAWEKSGQNPHLLYTDELRLKDAQCLLEQDFLETENQKEFVQAGIAKTAEERFAAELRSTGDISEMDPHETVSEKGRERVLRKALGDSSREVRQKAAAYLGRAPVKTLLDDLVEMVISDPENRVRRVAAESIVQLRDEKLFDELFNCVDQAGHDLKRHFAVVGGIARVQIAAENCAQPVDISQRIAALQWLPRNRIRLRVPAVRFIRAIPAFLLILIPQFALAAVTAGIVKAILGIGSYSIAQGDRSMGMGLFHGVVAAFFWGSFVSFGIALHRLVFSNYRDRHPLSSTSNLIAFFHPRGSIIFGAIGGLMGSYLIVLLIAAVFSSSALYTMGWEDQERDKSKVEYASELRTDMRYKTGYQWPYLFTGVCLGIGMAMMANKLFASKKLWEESQLQDQQLVDWRQLIGLLWRTTRQGLACAKPIPLMLFIGWVLAFTALQLYSNRSSPYDWQHALGLGPMDKQDLRTWKIGSWGQGLGIAGDELAQGVGGFFSIVGMALGLIVWARGINVEPNRD